MTFEKNIPNATAKRLSLSTIVFSSDSIVKISRKQALNKLLKRLGLTLPLFVETSPTLVS